MIVSGITLTTVKNLRPVIPGSLIYRSATLDDLSLRDAQYLLSGEGLNSTLPLAAVIDLRNRDEIQKGKRVRTEGSRFFYNNTLDDNKIGINRNNSNTTLLIHIPILRDINAFWEEAIDRMDPIDRMKATLQTVVKGGALDRAAARNLERGGLSLLYTIMLSTSGKAISTAIRACIEEAGRPVIFHCQKGKDRTGIIAMLLQNCCLEEDRSIIEAYALSGELLEEEEGEIKEKDDSSSSTIDWSYFRGSPASAMKETLDWINQRYGSVDGYLDSISIDEKTRKTMKLLLTPEKNTP